MGDGKKFGRKDMISLQKKLKINLHFPVGKGQLSWRNHFGRHQPLLRAGLNGRWMEIGGKDLVFL